MLSSTELRQKFLEYFENKNHEMVPSASLVPNNDPTLLFTNAGMVPFKDVFLGQEKRPYTRATSSQRCVRAGGKHNDLDQVGYTARHHTFFEMLGNFSFGDYFKKEAIEFAWDFLTNVLDLPKEKLWISVFHEDKEAEDIWLNHIKIDPTRFSRCGEEDNFWSMGETGPCGPCSEIFYDHGKSIAGGPPGSPEQDGDRYMEIWNLVFMQYDRDINGNLTPLPKPSVDTGMGLERLCTVLQGVQNNYDTDLFEPILQAISQLTNNKDIKNTSMRVIADHIRSCSFLLTDGVIPSNEGRGYVLRRIIRRAIRHGHKLGLRDRFFHKLVKPLVDKMGDAFPELARSQTHIEHLLSQEEDLFAKTLDQGLGILEDTIASLNTDTIPGDVIFKLYDTYGFPADLTGDIARERELKLDLEGFGTHMQKQREKSKKASKFSAGTGDKLQVAGETEFKGYEFIEHKATITALYKDNQLVNNLNQDDNGFIVLDHTPFYAESGGQVGDKGVIATDSGIFIVTDTQKNDKAIIHMGYLESGKINLKDTVDAKIDMGARQATALNHSATHLLHAALREILGGHVLQKGSLVDAKRLRFDFAHFSPLTESEIETIEDLVNRKIRDNLEVQVHNLAPEDAIARGALALFGEKYGDEVRVLEMGDFSMELCGGTHVKRTGDIGIFKITQETGIAAGIRRIEAITGQAVLDWINHQEKQSQALAGLLKTSTDNIINKLSQTLARNRELEKDLGKLRQQLAMGGKQDLADMATDINGIKVLAHILPEVDPKSLRDAVDHLKDKLHTAVILLATVQEQKVSLVAGVTKNCTNKIKAGDLVNLVASACGGKGGGRPDMAQAGGNQPQALPEAMEKVLPWVSEQLEK